MLTSFYYAYAAVLAALAAAAAAASLRSAAAQHSALQRLAAAGLALWTMTLGRAWTASVPPPPAAQPTP